MSASRRIWGGLMGVSEKRGKTSRNPNGRLPWGKTPPPIKR